jgi:hypothetical protein
MIVVVAALAALVWLPAENVQPFSPNMRLAHQPARRVVDVAAGGAASASAGTGW